MKTTRKRSIVVLSALSVLCCAVGVGYRNDMKSVAAEEASNIAYTYAEGGTTSAYLNELKISSFNSLEDFTNWFSLGYNFQGYTLADHLTYNEENKSVKIDTVSGEGAEKNIEFRLKPDADTGYSKYGNFEIKMTIAPANCDNSHNIYLGSRRDTDSNSFEYGGVKGTITGSTGASTWNVGSTVPSESTTILSGATKAYDTATMSAGITYTMQKNIMISICLQYGRTYLKKCCRQDTGAWIILNLLHLQIA